MLSQWADSTYKTLAEIALWVFLVASGLMGAEIGSMMNSGGWMM